MSGPEHREVARVLLGKAEGDLAAVRLLAADEHQSDHVVGFHAQQAVEKAIKAVLVSHEIEIPLTHDIGYLVKLCVDVEELPRGCGRRTLADALGRRMALRHRGLSN